jgi:hypothetical protein
MMCRTGSIFLAIVLGVSHLAAAQQGAGPKLGPKPIEVKIPRLQAPVRYTSQIAEILEDKCVGCHGFALAENRLSLEDVPAMRRGGKRGPALVPGKADESLLFRMAAHRAEPIMPPKDKPGNPSLTPEELGLIKLWIDAGAKDDSTGQPAGPKVREGKAVVLGELPPGLQPIGAVDMTASGTMVAVGRANIVQVYDVDSGTEIIALGGHKDLIQSVRFSPDGRLLGAGSYQIVTLWSVPTGSKAAGSWTERRTFGQHVDRVLALDFSPDGKLLAAGGGEASRSGELKVWEIGKGLLCRSLDSLHSDTVLGLRFSPDGTKLGSASADRFVKVTSLADGKVLRSFEGHTHHVMAVDWKANGKQLISGGADRVLKVWDYDSGEQVQTLQEAGKQITAVRWLAGKPEAVAASGDAQVRTWNTESGGVARSFVGPGDYVYAVAASTNGSRIAAGGADGSLFIWDGRDGRLLRKVGPGIAKPRARSGRQSRATLTPALF